MANQMATRCSEPRARLAARSLLVALAAMVAVGGCAEEEKKPRVRNFVVTIESVDLAAKTAVVSTYLEKHKREDKFEVEFNDQTEVFINGSLASFKDIRVGERANGEVKIVSEDSKKRLIAMSVKIERSEVLVAPGAEESASDKGSGDKGE